MLQSRHIYLHKIFTIHEMITSWNVDVALLSLWSEGGEHRIDVAFSGVANVTNWSSIFFSVDSLVGMFLLFLFLFNFMILLQTLMQRVEMDILHIYQILLQI